MNERPNVVGGRMLKIVVVDETAESRTRLVHEICALLRGDVEIDLLPQVSVSSAAYEELRHSQNPPHICVIGRELITLDVARVGAVKRMSEKSALFVALPPSKTDFETAEALARLGADDVLMPDITPQEFQRKIIFIARKLARADEGTITLFDSGKGGVGVTSLVAACGDALSHGGKSTVMVDFDFETQDLSRFLRARPFINEPLHLLLNGHSPTTREYVEECVVKLWEDPAVTGCVAPPPESDKLYDPHGGMARPLVATLQSLASLYSNVLIDVGALKGPLVRSLYRAANRVVLVINNDPATVFASTEKLNRIRAESAPDAKLIVVSNTPHRRALENATLKEAFRAGSDIKRNEWGPEIPYSKTGTRWAGSGETLYSLGGESLALSINELTLALGLLEDQSPKDGTTALTRFFAGIKSLRIQRRREVTHDESQQRLLPAPEQTSPPEELTPEELVAVAQGVTATRGVTVSPEIKDDEELDPRNLVLGA